MVENETLFHKIVDGRIPSTKVYEDDYIYAFKDINPVAPFHCLIIPKIMSGLSGLDKATDDHEAILGKMMVAASKIAKEQNITNGFRTVINTGEDGGQTVSYIHMHMIAGKPLGWPPG